MHNIISTQKFWIYLRYFK